MIDCIKNLACTGCTACMSICPQQSIAMELDEQGFYYPVVDNHKCTGCNLCEKVCPQLSKDESIKDENRRVFGAINLNKDVRNMSSSGGLFRLMAEKVLQKGGIVYGVAMSEDNYSANHIRIDHLEDLELLMGTKYIQSNLSDCFCEIKKLLEKGVLVLFTGTPCQIIGLKKFIEKEYDNLYTQDVICHGTPSPLIWKNYIVQLEKRYKSKAINVKFRYKPVDAIRYSLRIEFANGKIYCKDRDHDLYIRGYLSNCFLKPSCYKCNFKGKDRESDITLADFWGYQNYITHKNWGYGVSLLIIHSNKGFKLFEEIINDLDYIEVDDTPVEYNKSSIESVVRPNNYNNFWNEFQSGKKNIMKKYFGIDIDKKIILLLKSIKRRLK